MSEKKVYMIPLNQAILFVDGAVQPSISFNATPVKMSLP